MIILLKRGIQKVIDSFIKNEKNRLLLGEIVFATDTKQLLIGDPDNEKGYQVVSKVVEGPHNNQLYAELEGHKQLIPIGIIDH